VTGKCDLAPGYYGSTTAKKCPAGSISYGGPMPIASCIACPQGRVANKEQSECGVANAWDHWGYGECSLLLGSTALTGQPGFPTRLLTTPALSPTKQN
jgi:hypothetical protein